MYVDGGKSQSSGGGCTSRPAKKVRKARFVLSCTTWLISVMARERVIRDKGLRQRQLKGQCNSGVSEKLRGAAMEGTSFDGLRGISISLSSARLFAGPATDALTEAVEGDPDGLGGCVSCDEPTAG